MIEYPQGRGYSDRYTGRDVYSRDGYGYGESTGYGRHGGHGGHRRSHSYSDYVDDDYRRPRSGCIVDSAEYDRYGRYGGRPAGCIVDNGDYDRYGRYVPGGCVVDRSDYGPPGVYTRHSNYAGPSGAYVGNLNPYGAGMGNAAGLAPPVVSANYCVPYVAQFIIEQRVTTLSSGKFLISDPEGRLLFDVESKYFGIHTKRILCDAKGIPLCLLKKMNITLHDRWECYRGEDSSDRNLLFVMKKSAILQVKPSYDIFLQANTAMSKPDFTLKGDFYQHNYTVFYRDHIPVAEASRQVNLGSAFAGKDYYGVTVFPGVDHAFIASLIVIVDQIRQDDSGSSTS